MDFYLYPPFRGKFSQCSDFFLFVIQHNFNETIVLWYKLCHKLSASTARWNSFSVPINSYQSTNAVLVICNHIGNSISFCTQSQRTSSVNTNTDIDTPFFSKKCGGNASCFNERRKHSFFLHLSCGNVHFIPCIVKLRKSNFFYFTHKFFFPITISINVIRKFLCKLYFKFCVFRSFFFMRAHIITKGNA